MLNWLRKRKELRKNLDLIHTPIYGEWEVEIEGHGIIRLEDDDVIGRYVMTAYMMLSKSKAGFFGNIPEDIKIVTVDYDQRKIKALVRNQKHS